MSTETPVGSDRLQSGFFEELKALRAKYPMVYLEVWTPQDFDSVLQDEDEKDADWTDPVHVNTAGMLEHHCDPSIGTNWDRILGVVIGQRAGCDRCGTNDRMLGTKLCEQCQAESE